MSEIAKHWIDGEWTGSGALTQARRTSGSEDEGHWTESIQLFRDPVSRAELRSYFAQALAADSKGEAAIDQLSAAAAEATSGDRVPSSERGRGSARSLSP